MDYLKLHEDILEILPDGTIQELMEIAYRHVQRPILATNVTYTLLGSFPKEETGDYYWDYLNRYQKYNTEMMLELYEDGIMQSADRHKDPYLVDWGKAARDWPKIVGLIRIEGRTEGYVSLMCTAGEDLEELLKAMKIIQKACSILYASRQSKSNMETIQQKAFAGELLSGKIETREQLEQWYQNTGFQPGPGYMALAVRPEAAEDQTLLDCLYHEIQIMFPEQLSFVQGQILYVLRYRVEKGTKNEEQRIGRLQKLLEKFHCCCGASNFYYDLFYTADYLIQARDALDLGQKLYRNKCMYFYQDIALASIVYLRTGKMPERNYLHPAITILKEYDQKHRTDFLNTLKSYVENLGHSGNVLKELHIHRNSLLYRIAKIEEVTGCSLMEFKTFLHLALNFYVMELKEEEKKENKRHLPKILGISQ